jgi:AraC-like DNA-binding protein
MQLIRHHPGPPLSRYIDSFWWSERAMPQAYSEHMLPSGNAHLLFALHETPILCCPAGSEKPIAWSGSIVHGPQSSYYVAGPKPTGGIVGVSFRPGGAGAMLGVASAELAHRHIMLESIWGARGVDLHHRLMSAADPIAIFRILEQSLSSRIHRRLVMHPAVAHALASCPAQGSSFARVADLQRASGYSPRHFIALFRAATGMNPKQYYRIQRFNSAVRSLASGDGQSLSDISAAAGYSDQAHLSREFREFAGVAPTLYRPGDIDRPFHHRTAVQPARSAGKKSSRHAPLVDLQSIHEP